ncbi:unnamed protein product [Fraxinus pennsylvanica]|uniref:Uncharacterized protein n=1 Tax=Fraxinus pennsylvanica TaxID=56036 RepID=A0AAD1ZWR0_9LAMI|nr:unnamed protein product [Fraxinus pennsylvanica]
MSNTSPGFLPPFLPHSTLWFAKSIGLFSGFSANQFIILTFENKGSEVRFLRTFGTSACLKYSDGNDWSRPMTIFPAKSFRRSLEKLKERYLKRIEPKEDDDGELLDTKDEGGDGTEAPVSKFSGKKKGKAKKGGSNNALSASSFGLLGEGDDEDNEDSGITKRMLIKKNQDNEVAGFAPNEKQISELLKVGKDKRALKVAKRKLGTHKRAKKREEMAFVLQKMRAAGGGEKKK